MLYKFTLKIWQYDILVLTSCDCDIVSNVCKGTLSPQLSEKLTCTRLVFPPLPVPPSQLFTHRGNTQSQMYT